MALVGHLLPCFATRRLMLLQAAVWLPFSAATGAVQQHRRVWWLRAS